ncbi:MAG: hypoxanthine phosphoribosyltransferase [Granulosicoccus sp.]|jgi:hypoxanthine phosphoribosyltransferase
MSLIRLHDKEFEPYLSEDEIAAAIIQLAVTLNADYVGKNPLFVVVLNGAFVFASKIFIEMKMDCQVAFLRVSSYRGTESTGNVVEKMGLDVDLNGRHVVILEDIVDTGNTMERLRVDLKTGGAASVKICTMLFKPDAFKKDYPVEYIGLEIPDRFVVGLGLDYNELGRNIPSIYQLKQ